VKRSFSVFVSAALLFMIISMPMAVAAQEGMEKSPKATNEINLTDEQKSELKQLHEKMFEIKKQMIEKYVEYGIITKEQAQKKLEKLEKVKKLKEQNGYMPEKDTGKYWHKRKHNSQ